MPLLNVWDYEAAAAERLEPGAHGYYAGGAGDELTLLDHDVSMPLVIAPVAFQRVAHHDGEVGMARAAKAVGTVMCMSTMATSTPEEVAAVGSARWFQLYVFRDEGVTRELVGRVADAGFTALVLTVDTPFLGRRERDLRTGFVIPPEFPVASLGQGGLTPAET